MMKTKPKMPATFPKRGLWGVTTVLAMISSGVPKYAAACDEKKICVKYTTNEFQDNSPESGAVPLGTPVTDPETGVTQLLVDATGVRVTIIRPPPEPPLGLHLDADGCVEFPTQFAAGHQVMVYPDALVGGGQDVRITVHDWDPTFTGGGGFDVSEHTLVPRSGDVCDIPPIADGAEVWCSPSEYEWWGTMAVATHFVNKLDALPGSPLSGEDLDFVSLSTDGPGIAFYAFDEGNLALGQGASRHRFIVAHEMGHWIHSRVQIAEDGPSSSDLRPIYGYPAACHVDPVGPDPACKFAVVYDQPTLDPGFEMNLKNKLELHGIRSSEYSSAAMVEGFAHFAAAVAFNDISEEAGMFVYYKDIDYDAVPAYQAFVEDDGYRVDLPGSVNGLGGTVAWVENECPNDFDTAYGDGSSMQVSTAISSEIDWLRFFWEFLTLQSQPPQPEFWEIPQWLAHALIFDSEPWSEAACTTEDVLREMRVCGPLMNTLDLDPGNAGLDAYADRFDAIEPTHQVCR